MCRIFSCEAMVCWAPAIFSWALHLILLGPVQSCRQHLERNLFYQHPAILQSVSLSSVVFTAACPSPAFVTFCNAFEPFLKCFVLQMQKTQAIQYQKVIDYLKCFETFCNLFFRFQNPGFEALETVTQNSKAGNSVSGAPWARLRPVFLRYLLLDSGLLRLSGSIPITASWVRQRCVLRSVFRGNRSQRGISCASGLGKRISAEQFNQPLLFDRTRWHFKPEILLFPYQVELSARQLVFFCHMQPFRLFRLLPHGPLLRPLPGNLDSGYFIGISTRRLSQKKFLASRLRLPQAYGP